MKPNLSDFILASIQEDDIELFHEIKKEIDEKLKQIQIKRSSNVGTESKPNQD